MRFVLGVDGGGSKVTCLAANEKGELLGSGRGGPVNTNYTLRREAVDSACSAISAAMQAADLRGEQIAAAVISAPLDPRTLDEVARRCHLNHVVRAAEGDTPRWAARFWVPKQIGVTVDAGTGSLARGWSRDGREAGAGGFGATLGDEGSGFWISMQALRLVLQSLDGRSEATRLTPALLSDLGLSEPGELPFRVSGGFISTSKLLEMRETQEHYGVMIDSGQILGKDSNTHPGEEQGREIASFEAGLYFPRIERLEPLTRSEIAALCPRVVEVARQGDRTACQILHDAGEELGRLAAAVIKRLEMAGDEFAIVPFGGVFKAGELILYSFRRVCLAAAPHASVVLPKYEPEVGAVLLALHEIGVSVDNGVTGAIESSAARFPACIR